MKDLAAVEVAVGLGAKMVAERLLLDHVAAISFSLRIACMVLAASQFFSSS